MSAYASWVGADIAPLESVVTWPNAITLSGYAAGLAWLAGASPLWALWSLAADELDGEAARNLGQSSDIGERLDFGVDVAFAALIAMRLGLWWAAPALLLGEVMLKESGYEPPFGSARAAGMLWALAKGV